MIGVLVGVVTILSVFSWCVILANMIEIEIYVLVLAIFISWMMFNIYLLTLYTLSKRVLPCTQQEQFSIIATLGRYLILSVFGLIVSTPYAIMLFQSEIDEQIKEYRMHQINNYQVLSNQISQSDSLLITELLQNSNDRESTIFFQDYMNSLHEEKREAESRMKTLVKQSIFYTKSIVFLHTKYPQHWLFTAPFILLFILPAILKHYTTSTDDYCNIRRKVEMQLIEEEYKAFKIAYNHLFIKYEDQVITWRELYEDPPYNTKRKLVYRPILFDQDALIKELYND
jgi:hypothetical protein